ncbi:sulfate adenylyltransferase subunit 1 [Arthrobacter cryoconiti]|uniref:sulfate adenylyltransferase n=1 Tax=Arthrobacter cryoconiti TaxID=748907 RepID=A0ABV8R1G8_9MICC|nr:GTP-binding protein [Arthrobacter cryoconiti]MCC9068164.1 GTP-binding protein [Arthrobacter cryoconiti]
MSTVTETPLAHATLFRFATAGSVDDGKSTLVGRLLHDSKAILADTLDAVTRTSATRGFGGENGSTQRIDLALLTDGLRAEREQGITIDVAYRYFTTNRRSFILADCPGHIQYTKNTVTGASTADAVVVLIDARKGVLEQTRRHLSVLRLLRVPNVLVAVNKIDLVGFREDIFRAIEADLQSVAAEIGLPQLVVVPVSALEGDNVVDRSSHTPWYTGPSLLDVLETLPTTDEVERGLEPLRFPVQLVIRPQGALAPELVVADDAGAPLRDRRDFRDYRAYAGQLASGSVSVGEQITVLPSGRSATVIGIDFAGQSLQRAVAPQSVSLRLSEEIDIARGDVIAATGTFGEVSQDLYAELCWLSSKPLREGSKVLIKHGSKTVQALIRAVIGKLDLDTFGYEAASVLELNDIGTAQIRLSSALPIETYALHRRTGAFLVIDPQDGNTLAAGLVKENLRD